MQAELDSARAKVAELCPEGICVQEEDMILWELLALQGTLEEARYTNITRLCEHRLYYAESNDLQWLEKCITDKTAEREWLELAHSQCIAQAEAHCKKTGCELLPFKDVFERARDEIAGLEGTIKLNEERIMRMEEEYRHKIPKDEGKAALEFEIHSSLLANGRWYLKEEIETLEEEMAKLKRGEMAERGRKWLFDYLKPDMEEEDDD